MSLVHILIYIFCMKLLLFRKYFTEKKLILEKFCCIHNYNLCVKTYFIFLRLFIALLTTMSSGLFFIREYILLLNQHTFSIDSPIHKFHFKYSCMVIMNSSFVTKRRFFFIFREPNLESTFSIILLLILSVL